MYTIDEGEFICLVRPSGCGKSTLLNIIAGLEKPDSGEEWSNIKSKDYNRLLIFQEAALFPWLTVAEYVAYGLRLQKFLYTSTIRWYETKNCFSKSFSA